jgi:hypothetical protein
VIIAKHSIAMATSTGGRDHSPRNRSVNLCDPIRPVTPKPGQAEQRGNLCGEFSYLLL